MTAPGEIDELDWSKFDEAEDGVKVIELDGHRFRLPHRDILPQNVELSSLAQSIADDGIQTPIVVDDRSDAVIDGMTRLYVAHELGLDADEIPVKRESFASDAEAWWKALELNANRRQMGVAMRRQMVEDVVERKSWSEPREHVTALAKLFGVSKSTISRDLDEIYADDKVKEIKSKRSKLNSVKSGLRTAVSLIESFDDVSPIVPSEYRDEYVDVLEDLASRFEGLRGRLQRELDERNS